MDILLFIVCGLVLLLCLEVGGVAIGRGYGSYTRGVTQAWGGRDVAPADWGPASAGSSLRPRRARADHVSIRGRYPLLGRLLRGLILLVLLVGELYAGQNLFGSLWLGFVAWIATVLVSLAAA